MSPIKFKYEGQLFLFLLISASFVSLNWILNSREHIGFVKKLAPNERMFLQHLVPSKM